MTSRHVEERREILDLQELDRLALKEKHDKELAVILELYGDAVMKSKVLIKNASERLQITDAYLIRWKEMEVRQMQELSVFKESSPKP